MIGDHHSPAHTAADLDGNSAASAATPLRPGSAVRRAVDECVPSAQSALSAGLK
jgi:hypothetical protein